MWFKVRTLVRCKGEIFHRFPDVYMEGNSEEECKRKFKDSLAKLNEKLSYQIKLERIDGTD